MERLEESSITIILALMVPRRTLVNVLPRYVWQFGPSSTNTDTRLSYLDGGDISQLIRITG
jgi:hypothetical protein